MAYTKQTWACGDEITAEKLNHMEDGIGSCKVTMFDLTLTSTDTRECYVANATIGDVANAVQDGIVVFKYYAPLGQTTSLWHVMSVDALMRQVKAATWAGTGIIMRVFSAESDTDQLVYCDTLD